MDEVGTYIELKYGRLSSENDFEYLSSLPLEVIKGAYLHDLFIWTQNNGPHVKEWARTWKPDIGDMAYCVAVISGRMRTEVGYLDSIRTCITELLKEYHKNERR